MIAAALPPKLDGIGDYTACLAAELAQTIEVTILTAQGQQPASIANVAIHPVFRADHPRSVSGIADHLRADPPDWILLQYNPFSYGNRGYNPCLPKMLRQIKRQLPATRLAVMAHETFVPIISAKFAVMTTWQRAQFWQLGHSADALFLSIDPWARRFRSWFPHTPVHHLPVGSNIPHVVISRPEARQRLGIADDTLVLGLFGSLHASRPMEHVKQAAKAIQQSGREALLLYMGPHGQDVCAAMQDIPVIADGPLPPDEISRRFAALDIYLAPFTDGVSTRRTSLMTALQHGIATVGTRGCHTDAMLLREDGKAFLLSEANAPDTFARQALLLAADAKTRQEAGRQGQQLYEHEFAWNVITQRLLSAL